MLRGEKLSPCSSCINTPVGSPGRHRPRGQEHASSRMSHRTVQSAAICRLSNKHKQLICCAGSDFGERKTSHGFLLLLFRFFSITRCLIFGYFCLIVSLAIGCSRFFFPTLAMPDRTKPSIFSLVAIEIEEHVFLVYLLMEPRQWTQEGARQRRRE